MRDGLRPTDWRAREENYYLISIKRKSLALINDNCGRSAGRNKINHGPTMSAGTRERHSVRIVCIAQRAVNWPGGGPRRSEMDSSSNLWLFGGHKSHAESAANVQAVRASPARRSFAPRNFVRPEMRNTFGRSIEDNAATREGKSIRAQLEANRNLFLGRRL